MTSSTLQKEAESMTLEIGSDGGTAGPGTRRYVKTNCRICDPHCGLIAMVEDDRIIEVKPNKDHVFSKGHFCVKAKAAIEVLYDPDRVIQPLKRTGSAGEFSPVTWDEALDDIARRFSALRREHGPASVATFMGNPAAYSYAATMWAAGFQETLGVKWRYGINSEDAASRVAASQLMFGTPTMLPMPDFWRSHFAIVLGANPLVSHGSGFVEPKARDAMASVVSRGGRVVVVDPRRTETARQFEHIAIQPGTDAYFLIAMIKILLEEDLVSPRLPTALISGLPALRMAIEPFEVAECAARCRIPEPVIRALTRDLAAAPSGFVYGRCGTCQQMFGTLNNMLQDTVTILTGNLDVPGGLVFGWGAIDFEKFLEAGGGPSKLGDNRTRVNGHPAVAGLHPSTSLVPDILVPGPEQVRGLLAMAANPVLTSAGGGAAMEAALDQLELFVSLDLYMTETNKHAHYILPTTMFYEREDFPLMDASLMLRPSAWWSNAVVSPRGEVREEWQILQEIVSRMGLGGAYASPTMRRMARWGIRLRPRTLVDMMLRSGPTGDRFGLRRGGLNARKLQRDYPDGVRLSDAVPTGSLATRLKTPDKRIAIGHPTLIEELARLRAFDPDDADFPLRLIGMREIRSHNSWMHNAPGLMSGTRQHTARINPEDARRYDVDNGTMMRVESRAGTITIAAQITDDVAPGTIAIPHGWGHAGGWRVANAATGANSNDLASGGKDEVEPISGMSVLNGIPVRIAAFDPTVETSLPLRWKQGELPRDYRRP